MQTRLALIDTAGDRRRALGRERDLAQDRGPTKQAVISGGDESSNRAMATSRTARASVRPWNGTRGCARARHWYAHFGEIAKANPEVAIPALGRGRGPDPIWNHFSNVAHVGNPLLKGAVASTAVALALADSSPWGRSGPTSEE
jgi:hypothetical protein